MIKKLLYIILPTSLSLSVLVSSAQSNFKATTITLSNGTTKEGRIEYRNWDVAPKSIIFREDGSNSSKHYDSSELKSFHVQDGNTDVLFEKHKVSVEVTHMTNVEYFDTHTPEYETQDLLLRSIVKGKNSLFITYLNNKSVYYLSKDGEVPVELVNRSFINSNHTVFTDDKFRKQLKELGCADKKEIDKVSYSKNSLANLITKCNGEKGTYANQSSNVENRFGVVAGVDLGSNHYTESSPFGVDFANKITVPGKVGLRIGGFADFSLSKQQRQFSFYFEAVYSQLKNSGRGTLGDQRDYDLNVDFGYIKLSPLFRYYLKKNCS